MGLSTNDHINWLITLSVITLSGLHCTSSKWLHYQCDNIIWTILYSVYVIKKWECRRILTSRSKFTLIEKIKQKYFNRIFRTVTNVENINIDKGEKLTSKYITVPYILYICECCQTWKLSCSHFLSVKRERRGVGRERKRKRKRDRLG
jgi:hypothetical protein